MLKFLNVRLGYKIKSNCPHVGPGPAGGMSYVEVILMDPSSYLCEFRGKSRVNVRKAS